MGQRINVKLILELHEKGMSRNAIADTRHMSKASVTEVLQLQDQLKIKYQDVAGKSDDEVYHLFYPDKYSTEIIYEPVDYKYVHEELKKTGVTLKLLWQEYSDRCLQKNTLPVGYRRYCEGYNNHVVFNNLTNHLLHKPGESCEVDWSGPTMHFTDPNTNEVHIVYLFVGCLPFSQYAYVEPTLDMKMNTWIRCHVHMYEFFGGVPNRTICDNLKNGVTSHPRFGEIVLTEDYEALGMYYVTAIMPAQVRKPKQKPSAEGTVGKIATAIIAKLRNRNFASFLELKSGVSEALKQFNDAPFQKREGSRSLIHKEEIPYLRSLPAMPYEIASWDRGHKVGLNFHVIYRKNYYSVPYQYARETADLRITEHSVEIYVRNQRVATHNKFPDYVEYKYSTLEEHMPPHFLKQQWDAERIKKWADSIGPSTRAVINRIFESYKIKEQGYNPALSVLQLSKTYSQERLETACELALTKYRTPRYRHLNAILSANQDKVWSENKGKSKNGLSSAGIGYLRGNAYYGGNSDD